MLKRGVEHDLHIKTGPLRLDGLLQMWHLLLSKDFKRVKEFRNMEMIMESAGKIPLKTWETSTRWICSYCKHEGPVWCHHISGIILTYNLQVVKKSLTLKLAIHRRCWMLDINLWDCMYDDSWLLMHFYYFKR